MANPSAASVRLSGPFESHIAEHYLFFERQDPDTAQARLDALVDRLLEGIGHIASHPEIGRPAWFLKATHPQAKAELTRAQALAEQYGVGQFRELVLKPYLMLYAHGESGIVVLGLRHGRQLLYYGEGPD